MEIDKMVEKARKMKSFQAKKEEYGDSSKYVKFIDGEGNKANVMINDYYTQPDQLFR
jgi:hypothetical protein